MDNNRKIIYNTFIVYGQLLISMIFGLLSVRIVLKALGEESYGIYMLVGGVVAMLNIITTTLSNATMRFMSNSLGKGNLILLQKTFNTSILIHFVFAILLVLLLEIGGWVMFEYFLKIPMNRESEALIVYQFMTLAAFITLVSVPYDGIINAHENLLFLSIITILGQIVQLLIALYLLYFCTKNQLVIYGFGVLINQLLQRFIKQLYSTKHYVECRFNFRNGFDLSILKPMIKYIGWDFFSTATCILVTNLKNIFVNMFFGVKLNAAQGIATNVNGYVNNLSRGITSAITPQMNKSEGAGDRERLLSLTFTGVKYTTFMFALFSVPLIFENDYVLTLWLGVVPPFTVIFCQLILFNQLIDKMTWQICNAVRSVGDIKLMTVLECLSNVVYVFAMYNILNVVKSPEYIYIAELFFIIINGGIRLKLFYQLFRIRVLYFVKVAILPVVIPMIFPVCLVLFLQLYMSQSFVRMILVFIVFVFSYVFLFLFIGLKKDERDYIYRLITSMLPK